MKSLSAKVTPIYIANRKLKFSVMFCALTDKIYKVTINVTLPNHLGMDLVDTPAQRQLKVIISRELMKVIIGGIYDDDIEASHRGTPKLIVLMENDLTVAPHNNSMMPMILFQVTQQNIFNTRIRYKEKKTKINQNEKG